MPYFYIATTAADARVRLNAASQLTPIALSHVDRMKGILFLAAALFVSVQLIAAAGVRYRTKVWSAVQTYDVAVLSKNLEEHVRELAGMKCSFRGKDIRHPRPNWYQGSVWQPIAGQSGKFANVAVMVAKHDLAAFKSLPTDSSGEEKLTRSAKAGFSTLPMPFGCSPIHSERRMCTANTNRLPVHPNRSAKF